ncbi:hypothetical protein TNCT_426411 [Trichonephila clavata]|uniref:Uncharacterized protein n=1 Tax=Trichonephila clavata TaxID=2740835 RepID=A0A8X6IBA8_TRICU|nr:hypothetical protein TNCT_426411 [Trichonephila clavata]
MLICSQYPPTDMFPLVIVLCFIPLFHSGLCDDDCAPSFADTCFTGVSSDLKYMLNLNKMVAINVSIAAVHDLCL